MSHIETTSARAAPGPLRVAHVVQSFDVGGIERVVDALATHAPDDMEHEVFAYLHDGPLRDALRAEGVRATFLPTETGLQPTLPLRLARHLRTRGVDVLHSHHVGPFLYGGVAARLVGIPHVHTEHSVELYDVWRRRLIGRAMPRLATVVAVAPDVARWRTDRFGDSPRVILNGIPVPPLPGADAVAERRGALGIGPEAFVVGCVARLAPEKAHGYLVDAFARLAESTPDAHLVLVGDGPERPIITRRAADRGVDGRVHLLGSRMDVPDLLGTFDVVALSSVSD